MSQETRPVELLLAHEDGTWTTEVFGVPIEKLKKYNEGSLKWERAVVDWAQEQVMTQAQYREIVHIGIYCYDPDNMGSPWQQESP